MLKLQGASILKGSLYAVLGCALMMGSVLAAGYGPQKNLPAFPGAQGDGAASKGGRGGKVLVVDRLDDPCPTEACTTEDLADPELATEGTLRWALLQPYPRTVVFRVAGVIRLQEDILQPLPNGGYSVERAAGINITSPYLTVAGQTAPRGGITIAGNGIGIRTHDVVFRYLRFRSGRGTQPVFRNQQNPETLMIVNGAERVIIDHCSLSWMPVEGMAVYTGELFSGTGTASDITLSWNIVGEGLVQNTEGLGHPNAAFTTGFDGDPQYAARNVSVHHNLFLHTQKRNGDLLNHNARFINNLIYNWQWMPSVFAGGLEADVIGNVWKPGPMSIFSEAIDTRAGVLLVPAALDIEDSDWWHAVPGTPSLYLRGNAYRRDNVDGRGRGNPVLRNQQDILCYFPDRAARNDGICRNDQVAESWLRKRPMPRLKHRIRVHHARQAERRVLRRAGASRRINARGRWVRNRDAVDRRFVADYRKGSYDYGRFPFHENEVGGYPHQRPGRPYKDTDRDGMSDWWEQRRHLNPHDPEDARQVDHRSGYTHLERFINGMR